MPGVPFPTVGRPFWDTNLIPYRKVGEITLRQREIVDVWITREWSNIKSAQRDTAAQGQPSGASPLPGGSQVARQAISGCPIIFGRASTIRCPSWDILPTALNAAVFYDKYYEAELARLNLDTYLQQIYHDDSDLIAVFLWPNMKRRIGAGWNGAIRDLIKKRDSAAIMPFRFDETSIPGLFSTDGYIEIGTRPPGDVASLILERLEHNNRPQRDKGVGGL